MKALQICLLGFFLFHPGVKNPLDAISFHPGVKTPGYNIGRAAGTHQLTNASPSGTTDMVAQGFNPVMNG